MKPMSFISATSVALFALIFAGSPARVSAQGPASDRQVVTIALVPEVVLDDTVVYLDQIAKLSGGPVALRQRLARLDVAEFKLTAERMAVLGDQVKFRLMLAGISASQFQMDGAKRTMVMASDEPVTTRKILAIAEQALRSKYPSLGVPKDIAMPLLELRRADQVEFEARVPAGIARTGGPRVDVAIMVNGKMREIVPVSFETNAKAQPSKLERFDAEVRTRLDLPKEKSEPLIRTRDLVRIVAMIGSAQVVATGEAQQDGRLGEIIRVRNVESNRVVNGRVESRDVVLVDY